jgi:peptidoglycan-associated lipoprotein
MFWRKLASGRMMALTVAQVMAGVAVLHLAPSARAEDRMQLGAPPGSAAEFQGQVGDRVFFSEGSAELGARARAALEAQAAWLVRHPSVPIAIEGHADEAGTARHNLEVSQRRAQAVRARLIERGVAPERIGIVAYGRERLIAECTEPICGTQNRRTVTILGPPGAARPGGERPDRLVRPTPRRLF